MSDHSRLKFIIINIVLPLIIGLVLYICLNPDAFVTRMFMAIVPVGGHAPTGEDSTVLILIKYYMADMLWSYALTVAVGLILHDNSLVIVFMVSAVFLTIIEILQLTNVVKGTFDLLDIIVETVSCLLAIVVLKKYRKERRSIA